MNKRQESAKDSFGSVEKVMDQNAAVTAEIPGLNQAVTQFKTDFSGIDEAAGKVDMESTKGKTSPKHDAEEVLVTMEYPIVCALRSLSRKNGDKELFTIMDLSESDLVRQKDAEVTVFAKEVLGFAKANAGDLAASYNIKDEALTAFQNQIDVYDKAGQTQGAGFANRESGHESLKALIGKLNDDLVEVDDMMELVRHDHPDFYNAYCDARPVKLLGVRHKKQQPSPQPPQTK